MADLETGQRLGAYRLEERLGEGGMGVVFRAVHEPEGDEVALKVLRAELSADETFRQRFVHEARAAGEVRHKHLVPITDAGEAEGRPYLAVAFVRGQTLEARLASVGPLPLRGHGPRRGPRRVGVGRAARRRHRAPRRQAVAT